MVYSDPGDVESKGGKSGTLIYSAIVVDFISNPSAENFTSKFELYRDTNNKEEFIENNMLLDRVPRNSIIGRLITDGKGKSTSNRIFFPFFPPYLSLPLKPGEQVWIIFESLNDTAGVGYWMARKHADLNVDDINYTHLDRMNPLRTQQSDGALPGARDTFAGEGPTDYFDFPAGGGLSPANNTLEDPEGYEIIYAAAASIGQFVGEAVPRFTKRSPDLTLQGSNNTLICMGTDRIAGEDLNTTLQAAGTIDMVCGRGQEGSVSAPLVATNTRALNEVNKVPLQSQKGDPNLTEGDPDFVTDLSRIYVSMKTDGDKNFDLEFTNSAAPQVDGAPYIVAKSTEVRLIGRDGGSVRLIKEGDTQSEICLMSNGTIAIEGITGSSDASRTTQPTIRGEDLVLAIEAFAAALGLALAEGTGTTKGNMGGALVDGDGESTGIRAAANTLAEAARTALSGEVYIK